MDSIVVDRELKTMFKIDVKKYKRKSVWIPELWSHLDTVFIHLDWKRRRKSWMKIFYFDIYDDDTSATWNVKKRNGRFRFYKFIMAIYAKAQAIVLFQKL